MDSMPGVCLVDHLGRVLAANSKIIEAGIRDPQLNAAIDSILDGVADLTIEIQGENSSPRRASGLVRLRRLTGDDGPLALVEFFSQPPLVATPRVDPLTKLFDRAAIGACVQDWRRNSTTRSVQFSILFLDLDGFKQINDLHGHAAGDQVLKTLASRWLASVRDGDLVARYGGDEFVVLVKEAATNEEINSVVRRLRQATELPVEAGGVETTVSVTIGVATCDSAEQQVEELIAAADRDMYAQKRAARKHAAPS